MRHSFFTNYFEIACIFLPQIGFTFLVFWYQLTWVFRTQSRGSVVVVVVVLPRDVMLARYMLIAVILCVFVCLSVCLSITSQCSTKTAKCRITETMLHDSPGTLVS